MSAESRKMGILYAQAYTIIYQQICTSEIVYLKKLKCEYKIHDLNCYSVTANNLSDITIPQISDFELIIDLTFAHPCIKNDREPIACGAKISNYICPGHPGRQYDDLKTLFVKSIGDAKV